MSRIQIEAPGRPPFELELAPGEAVLLGREPDPSLPSLPSERPIRPVVVDSAIVSANHALVWSDETRLYAQDLASRNGTWLKLPAGAPIGTGAGAELRLRLSPSPNDESPAEGPADARFASAEDFAPAVAASVQAWLERLAPSAQVVIRPSARERDSDLSTRIPLAVGGDLQIVMRDTVDADWPATLQQIWRFVSRQNLLVEAEEETRKEGLVLANETVRQAHRRLVQAAARSVRSVLIVGPTGAGKEGMARAYHRHSGRGGPLVTLNCSMFNKELLRSELFGAEEGSFTGAVKRIVGAVERAQGGTLFLDEIGEMPGEVQAMLLRFLDRGEYERIGGYGQVRTADVRVVCATNRDLRAAFQRGEFRADLWYRLSVVVIELPPLSQRPEDLAMFLETRRLGPISVAEALSPEATALLARHSWGGNFRELENFVERLPVIGPGKISAELCHKALEQGALVLPRETPASAPAANLDPTAWQSLVGQALSAYGDDHQGAAPARWDEVKEYLEKYFKPLLFCTLAGFTPATTPAELDVPELARRLGADRGTVQKQANRYFECYRK